MLISRWRESWAQVGGIRMVMRERRLGWGQGRRQKVTEDKGREIRRGHCLLLMALRTDFSGSQNFILILLGGLRP